MHIPRHILILGIFPALLVMGSLGCKKDPPDVHQDDPPEITVSGGPDDRTRQTQAQFALSCSREEGCGYECDLDGAGLAPCSENVVYEDLADGAHVFQAVAIGADELRSSPATRSWTVDTAPPEITDLHGPADPTAEVDATFTFDCSKADCIFACRLEGSVTGVVSATAECENGITYPGLPDDTFTFTVQATDDLGNEGAPANWSFNLFTEGPLVTITDGPPETTGDDEATFAFECVDTEDCTYECAHDRPDDIRDPFTACTSPMTVSALEEGLHTFRVRAIDDLGNVGQAAERSWTVLGFFWESISAGFRHSCGIDGDGALWCWGSKGYGQLGIGGETTDAPDGPVATPARVGTASDWRQVSAGYRATCGIRGEGSLYCWGRNTDERLGVSGGDEVTEPALVGTETDWIAVATSRVTDGHTCGLRDGGSLWCWGNNSSGQLGVGDTELRASPTRVGTELGWTTIGLAGLHTCGIREGELWCWGRERDGTLGIGEEDTNPEPVRIESRSDWMSLAVGSRHICGLTADGALWCWGINEHGRLGLGDTIDRDTPTRVEPERTFSSASAGTRHVCALASDQSVLCWGRNHDGRLGLGDLADQSSPLPVPGLSSIALVTVGETHSCALTGDGTASCWGGNLSGQLGLPDHGWSRHAPGPPAGGGTWQAVDLAGQWSGIHYGCGIQDDGSLWCWGWNNTGQLGVGDHYNRKAPTRVGEATDWDAIATASGHACGLRNSGELWCWGENSHGQLGLGDGEGVNRPTRVGEDSDWIQVSARLFHTCGIRSGGTLWCWGRNSWGSVGVNDTEQRDSPVQVDDAVWGSVFAGWYATCGIRDDGSLWCWGRNGYGKLGVGGSTDRHVPTRVGSHQDWLQVETNSGHTCGVRDTDALYCWGGGHEGRLGIGTMPQEQTSPARVAEGTSWARVSTGSNHTCAIDADENLWCWGANWDGQLGIPDHMGEDEWFMVPVPIGDVGGWSHIVGSYSGTAGLRSDEALWIWGRNAGGALGNDTAWETSPGPVTLPDTD